MTKQGYGTELGVALVRYAFEALKDRFFFADHAEPNLASATLIQKLGFSKIMDVPLGYQMPDGELVNSVGYAMDDPNELPDLEVSWPKIPAK